MTKYPNLLAEYEARSWNIIHWASKANVTPELMEEVLYNGAELTPKEIENLGYGFGKDYISSPELKLIDTNDKITRVHLDKFIEWFNNVKSTFNPAFEGNRCDEAHAPRMLADAYLTGKPISRAMYNAGISAKESIEQALKPKSAPRSSKFAEKPVLLSAGHKTKTNIQIVEYQSSRVLTTQQLAAGYGTETRRISENYNANKTHYEQGKHFYLLEGQELKDFKREYGNCVFAENLNKLYLWTERGALLHAKSLNTDKAWEVYDMLVETYFRVKSGAIPTAAPPQKYSRKSSDTKQIELETKLNNSRARIARELGKIAARPEITPEYKQILYTHATAALTGKLDNIKEALQ